MVDFHTLEGTADFYFTRHGESEGNRAGIVQGRTPSTLTERGREQARETGKWFRSRKPDVILTSPLVRALQTAHIIAEESGCSGVRAMEELVELDTGIFSNLTYEQAATLHPVEWDAFQKLSWEGVPDAESIASLSSRAHALWETLIAMAGSGTRNVLCVSHSGFLQWIIRATLGSRSWMPLISTSGHCAISRLHVNDRALDGKGGSYYVNWLMINIPPSAATV